MSLQKEIILQYIVQGGVQLQLFNYCLSGDSLSELITTEWKQQPLGQTMVTLNMKYTMVNLW